jgi:hypothetical protein
MNITNTDNLEIYTMYISSVLLLSAFILGIIYVALKYIDYGDILIENSYTNIDTNINNNI